MAAITFLPVKNVYISQWYADRNFSAKNALFVSQYKQAGDDYRSLLHFDLSGIPTTSTIEKAELILTMYRNEANQDGANVNLYHLLNNWEQNNITWNTQPPFDPVWDASLFISHFTPPGRQAIDITELVKGWYDGSLPNNGILLAGNENGSDLIAFHSTNYILSNAWPLLSIKFVEGILEGYETQEITIPVPPDYPIMESNPISLGPREKATCMVLNTSDSHHVQVMMQVGFDNAPDAIFFDAGPWHSLEPRGYPGEALALSTADAAEFARVLVRGEGGETILIYPRTREE